MESIIDLKKLQKVQDTISKFSILPIKIYSFSFEENELKSLSPVTRWSNPSFIHWLHDIATMSKKDSFLTQFNGLANGIKNLIEENLKRKISQAFEENWKNDPWEITEFSPLNNYPSFKFYLFPILNTQSSRVTSDNIKYVGISGGFKFSDNKKNSQSLQDAILQISKDLKKYEKRILIEELTEIPELLKEVLENRIRSIRGCLTAFVSYYKDFEDDVLETLFQDLYRFSYKRTIWQRYFKTFDNLLDEEFLGLVISILPITKKEKYLQKIFGFGYPIFYPVDKGEPVKSPENIRRMLYIYSEEENKKFYIENNLSVVPENKPWKEVEEWIHSGKIHDKLITFDLEHIENGKPHKLGSLHMFLKNVKKVKKKHLEKLNWNVKFISEELYEAIKNTRNFSSIAINEYKRNQVELIKDLVAYAHLKEEKQLIDIIQRFSEVTKLKNLKFLTPAFFHGDAKFFNVETGQIEHCQDVYENIFNKGKPSYTKFEGNGVYLYVSTTMTQKVIGLLSGYKESPNDIDEILDMMLVFSTIISPKLINLKIHSLNKLIEHEIKNLQISLNYWISDEFSGRSDSLAEEIGKLIGAHHVGLWIYTGKNNKIIRWGVAGENPITNRNAKVFNINEVDILKKAIENAVTNQDGIYILTDWQNREDKNLKSSTGSYSDIHLLISISSKLKNFELTEEDRDILSGLTEKITGLLRSRFSPINEKYAVQRTVDAVVHELMTPVVNLKHGLEHTINYVLPQNDFDKVVEFLEKDFTSDLERLSHNINSIPILSTLMRDEEIKYQETGRIIKKQFWTDVINTMKRIFFIKLKNKGIELKFVFNKHTFPKYMVMDAVKFWAFNIVLYNLMENAVKYSFKNTTVRIKGEARGSAIYIYFENEGIGIPHGEEEKIFEKGIRGSNVNSAARSGSGLGLFFSKKIMESLDGEIKLIKNDSPTTFLLKLPEKYFQKW